ncbi:MAG: helix-turn-helix domain-containing protein [Oscillospiraceae bacterium]|nr:helix-turn-helix domain-containing protein [Oscillospiraceae bacterium]
MSIHISDNIKRLRRLRGLTQEALAEVLDVSAQSVSRWECGENFPDITLLPAIANFFDVSTDVLLGMDELRDTKRVEEARAKTDEIARDWNYPKKAEETLAIWSELARDMPNNWDVQVTYARAIEIFADPMYIPAEDAANYISKVLPIYERILGNCTDDNIRCRAISWLTLRYCALEELDKAREYANRLPAAEFSREMAHNNIAIVALDLYERANNCRLPEQQLLADKDVIAEILKPFEAAVAMFANLTHQAFLRLIRARVSYGLVTDEEYIKLLELDNAAIELSCINRPEVFERGNVFREYYSELCRAYVRLDDLESAATAAEKFVDIEVKHPWSEMISGYNMGEDGKVHGEEISLRKMSVMGAESFAKEQLYKHPELQDTPEKLLANHPRYIAALARLREGEPG